MGTLPGLQGSRTRVAVQSRVITVTYFACELTDHGWQSNYEADKQTNREINKELNKLESTGPSKPRSKPGSKHDKTQQQKSTPTKLARLGDQPTKPHTNVKPRGDKNVSSHT